MEVTAKASVWYFWPTHTYPMPLSVPRVPLLIDVFLASGGALSFQKLCCVVVTVTPIRLGL